MKHAVLTLTLTIAGCVASSTFAGPTISAQPAPPPVPQGVEWPAAEGDEVVADAGAGLGLPENLPVTERAFDLNPADRAEVLARLDRAASLIAEFEPHGFGDEPAEVGFALRADVAVGSAQMRYALGDVEGARAGLARVRAAVAELPEDLAEKHLLFVPGELAALEAGLAGADVDPERLTAEQVCEAWLDLSEMRFLSGDLEGGWASLQGAVDAIPVYQAELVREVRESPSEYAEDDRWTLASWTWIANTAVWLGCDYGDPARAAAMLEGLDLPASERAAIWARIASHYAGVGQRELARELLDGALRIIDQDPDGEAMLDAETLRAAIRLGDDALADDMLAQLRQDAWGGVELAYIHGAQAQALAQRGQRDRARRTATMAVGLASGSVHEFGFTPMDVGWEAYSSGWELGAGGLTDEADALAGGFAFRWAQAYFHMGVAEGLINRGYAEYAPIREPLGD